MDAIKFLADMAAYYDTAPAVAQERFVRAIQQNRTLLCEADGGIGKTLGYLVYAMNEAHRKGRPALIATSTIMNRDQIETEYKKIVEFARHIGDPIADIPLFNYRSARDYASAARLDDVIARRERTDTPQSVLDQLYEIRERLNGSDVLLDTVMPNDTAYGDDVIVERREIAARRRDDEALHQSFFDARDEIKQHANQPCVIMMTQVMLAISRQFQYAVEDGEIAMVVIDEVDKLTSIDFVTFTNLVMDDIETVLDKAADADIDIDTARAVFERLQGIVAEIKKIAKNRDKNVILIYANIGEERTKAVHAILTELGQQLDALAAKVEEAPTTGSADEIAYRRLLYTLEESANSADLLRRFMYPHGTLEWTVNKTESEVFLSWHEADEFRVVTARPGALMEWLFRKGISVQILLTTAFVGEPIKWFARKIGLPINRLTSQPAIRAKPFGTVKFFYFTKLQAAILDKKPNPAHFDDIERILRLSPQGSWEPGKRIVVLTPGYEDIKEIHNRLRQKGSNAPIFPHVSGTSINGIRDKLIQSTEGGILLTVYWEGFNIVGNQGRRRGLIDVLVMSRIPFQPPNPTMTSLHKHLGWGEHWVPLDNQNEAKRRIHQGFNRLIRGPDDKGSILICDSRFPPPTVLTDTHDEISAQRWHIGLLEAIPDRFRTDAECFDLVDAETWETL